MGRDSACENGVVYLPLELSDGKISYTYLTLGDFYISVQLQ